MENRPDKPNRNPDPINENDLTQQGDAFRERDLTQQGDPLSTRQPAREPDMSGPRESLHDERTVTDEEDANPRDSTVFRQEPDPVNEQRGDRVREERAHTAPTLATGMFLPVIILLIVAVVLIVWFVL